MDPRHSRRTMNTPTVTRGRSFDEIVRDFRWSIPARFNIGTACADVHPRASVAVVEVGTGGNHREFTYGALSDASNRFANALRGLGLTGGDRVAVLLGQSFAT